MFYPPSEYRTIAVLLQEATHHLVGLDADHGVEYRCALLDVYAEFVPEHVSDIDYAALNDGVC